MWRGMAVWERQIESPYHFVRSSNHHNLGIPTSNMEPKKKTPYYACLVFRKISSDVCPCSPGPPIQASKYARYAPMSTTNRDTGELLQEKSCIASNLLDGIYHTTGHAEEIQ
jgi:hypothetical protein